MRRGEVYWYQFGRPDKRRPVVVLTGTPSLGHLSTVTVAAVTSTIRGTRSEVVLGTDEGMPKPCAINLHGIHTVEQKLLLSLMNQLSDKVMDRVEVAMRFALGFGERLGDS